MDKKIICKCPKCHQDLTDGRFNYECEDCGFKCNKEIWGVPVTEEMIIDICNGKSTEVFTFKKPDKEWDAKLKYSSEEEKVVFEFEKKSKPTTETIGKCPHCGGDVRATKDYYLCENYKKNCNLIIGKNVRGHEMTAYEVKKLLNNEILPEMEFTWQSGKSGKAQLKIGSEGKLEYIFPNRK